MRTIDHINVLCESVSAACNLLDMISDQFNNDGKQFSECKLTSGEYLAIAYSIDCLRLLLKHMPECLDNQEAISTSGLYLHCCRIGDVSRDQYNLSMLRERLNNIHSWVYAHQEMAAKYTS